jgi:ribokinase
LGFSFSAQLLARNSLFSFIKAQTYTGMPARPIIVIGSSNTDMVVKTTQLPLPGETVLGGTFFMNAGGKGANQAVAAARLGGHVSFIARTGDDIFGKQAKELFDKEGIDTSFIIADPQQPSGVALITVDEKGENCIVVASGANAALLPVDVEGAKNKIENAALVLMQLEIPLRTVAYAASLAHEKNIRVVLNPAPACKLDDELLKKISIITPNQKEAGMLTGIKVRDRSSAEEAAKVLHAKGIETVIITMSAEGALVLHKGQFTMIAAPKVTAIDTTAAGDIFNGALVTALAEGNELADAVTFACEAAAISVTRLGAQASAPFREEVMAKLKTNSLIKS